MAVAGVVELGFSDFWHIQIEPGYIQKGIKSSNPAAGLDLFHRLDYFEIPVLVKVMSKPADFIFSNTSLVADISYSHGLTNITNANSFVTTKSYGIQLLAGAMFDL
jgi:hypothetical protein